MYLLFHYVIDLYYCLVFPPWLSSRPLMVLLMVLLMLLPLVATRPRTLSSTARTCGPTFSETVSFTWREIVARPEPSRYSSPEEMVVVAVIHHRGSISASVGVPTAKFARVVLRSTNCTPVFIWTRVALFT